MITWTGCALGLSMSTVNLLWTTLLRGLVAQNPLLLNYPRLKTYLRSQ